MLISKPVALIQVPAQRLFSPRAAARYLDVSHNVLRSWTAAGLIAAILLPNGHRRYLLEDLQRFIESLPGFAGDKMPAGENLLLLRKKGGGRNGNP